MRGFEALVRARSARRHLSLVALLAAAPLAQAQLPVRSEHVAGGLIRPVLVLAAPGDASRLFVVEQWGRVQILRDGQFLPEPFLEIGGLVASGGEQGLLGMAFHPDYPASPYAYVGYVDRDGSTRVVRYSLLDADRLDPDSAQLVLGPVVQADPIHNGGSLAFAHDGTLFVGMGDGGHAYDTGPGHAPQGNAQSPSTVLGKLLRLDVDQPFPHVPSDNPYRSDPRVDPRVWAFGLREPWRFSFDRERGDLYLGDVGQGHSEEIDRVLLPPEGWGGDVKRNFGWRCVEGVRCTGQSGCECTDPELIAPFAVFDHDVGCAVIGGHVYRGCSIPALRGWYVYATFCYTSSSRVFAFPAEGAAPVPTVELTHLLAIGENGSERITSFGEDAHGELYFCLLEGSVRSIRRANPLVDCNGNGVQDSCDIAHGTSTDADGDGEPDECAFRRAGPPQPAPGLRRP